MGEPGTRLLADDLVNFHCDPVTCAVAPGWAEAVIEERRLSPVVEGHVLLFRTHPRGRPTRVVVDVDGEGFTEKWLGAVEAAQG
jgi:hypothetical protein